MRRVKILDTEVEMWLANIESLDSSKSQMGHFELSWVGDFKNHCERSSILDTPVTSYVPQFRPWIFLWTMYGDWIAGIFKTKQSETAALRAFLMD